MAVASSGNLSFAQSVRSTLIEGLENPETGELETLLNAPTMFQAAQRIGKAIRAVRATEYAALKAADVDYDVSFLFGGQIKGGKLRLYMVYSAGNFIECTTDCPESSVEHPTIENNHIAGMTTLDLSASYEFDRFELFGTIENLTNHQPPSIGGSLTNAYWQGQGNAEYDRVGRQYRMGARFKF